MKKKLSAILFLISLGIAFNASAFFNLGVDVEGRVLASATTSVAYYSILGTSSGASYSGFSNPIKKIDVYAQPVDWNMPWSSALFKVEFNCNTNVAKTVKIEYFSEKNAKGRSLPASMINIQKDIANFNLPKNVLDGVYKVACV